MIEVKKYIEEDEVGLEFLKILSEASRKISIRAAEINKLSLSKISMSSLSDVDLEAVEQLVHAFRSELYKADLAVSQLQDLLNLPDEGTVEQEEDALEDAPSE